MSQDKILLLNELEAHNPYFEDPKDEEPDPVQDDEVLDEMCSCCCCTGTCDYDDPIDDYDDTVHDEEFDDGFEK